MKYAIIPILKILWLLSIVIIATPVRWIYNLVFHFKLISIRYALTYGGVCMLDYSFKEYMETIFSKEATNDFINN